MTVWYEVDHNTPEWHDLRLGKPTSSAFNIVMMKGRGGGISKTRTTYMLKLAGERLTGEPMDSYTNHHMERGHEQEPEALDLYAFMQDAEPLPGGFFDNDTAGASPDGLLDSDGVLEIKTCLPHIQLERILCDQLPPEYKAQVQGQLWVSGRQWCDFVSYSPKLPLFVKRVERDDKYIAEVKDGVEQFCAELDKLMERFQ